MKKNILAAAAALLLPLWAQAGEITAGSTPRSINYQGRLERDNAPITGTIHLYFRIFNTATGTGPGACGAVNQPCLWQSEEITVEATQGVFSANLEFTDAQMLYVFSGTAQKYLEVQVESDVLSPREPINSVVYAMVAKKLEDGSSVSVTTLTANYQVLLATAASARVGVGTNSPVDKLNVAGGITISGAGNGLTFPNGTVMVSAGVGSAVGGVTSDDNVVLRVANAVPNTVGDVIFNTPLAELARITNSGSMGIGTPAPMGKLDVNGSLYVGNEGVYDRTGDGEVNVKEDLVVEGGKLRGTGSNYISLGETANTIIAGTNGSDRLWLDPAGNLGAGTAAPASEKIYAAGNIRSSTGVRGSNVSIGAYNNTWAAFPNEVRAADNTDLLLQQSNPYYVGIGTNTPREKLHVRGTVLADYGVKSSTALFTSNVNVNGDFTANGNNKNVYLTTTTIYGTLTVTGGVATQAGMPAYITSTQTFTGQNTFMNQLLVSSDIVTANRIGAAVTDFDFPGGRYLQVGDNKVEYSADDTSAYLVGGSGANAKLRFYRGPTEAASVETLNGRNLAVMVEGQARTLTDANYHRVQNAALWVSTAYASTPGLFVSSTMANVGMGTTVMDPNWKLTVEGNLRISTASSPGQSYGIIFADGSSMHTAANIGSATGLSNNGDAVIQSDADLSGSGNVLLRAGSLDGFILNSGGNVGIGTVNPVSKLNVRGGDLVLGTPVNPYASNGIEDLIVGGNTVFDGALIQRSAAAVELSNLIVANSVYLSTATGARAVIGGPTLSPDANTALYVTGGDLNLDSGYGLSVNETAPVGWYLRGDGDQYIPGMIQNGDIPAAIARTTTTITLTLPLTGSGDLSDHRTFGITGLNAIGTANYVPGVNAAGTGWEYKQLIPVANETTIVHGANSITIGIADPLIVDKGGTGATSFTPNGVLYGDTANPVKVTAAGTQYEVLQAGAGGAPVFGALNLGQAAAVTGTLPLTRGGTGGLLTSTYGGTGANLSAGTIGDVPYFSGAGVMGYVDNGAANYLLQANGAAAPSWVESTTANTGNTIMRRDANGDVAVRNISANTVTANNFVGDVSGGSGYIYKAVDTDYIVVRAIDLPAVNSIELEIATADDATEPIYVRQYTGQFVTVARQAALLDAAGNTSFPGTVSAAAFSGPLTGAASLNVLKSGDTMSGALAMGGNNISGVGTLGATTGNLTNLTVTNTIAGSINGNAATVTNGVVTTGSYANPAWISSLGAGKITGTLTVGNGGTGANTFAAGVVHANGTNAFTAGDVNLTSEVTGTLPVANGGTGISAAGASGKVVCWKATGVLGVCGDAPGAGGTCTCN